jgi:hypothetical protein
MEQPIDGAIAPHRLNNLGHICNFDAAIPQLIGQNSYRSPQVALALAFAAQHRTRLPHHRCHKRRQQSLRSLGLTVPVLADPDLAGFRWTLTTCQTPYLGRRF